MEERNIARFPRPVHHRIPNFVNSEKATERLAQLPELTLAKCIKVPSEIKALIIPSLPIPGHILDRQNMLWAFFTNAPPEALEVDARWPCRYSSRERIREVVRHRYEGTRSEIHDRIRKLSAAYPQRTTFQLMQLLPGLVPPCQRKEGGKRDQRISLSAPFTVKLALKTWLY